MHWAVRRNACIALLVGGVSGKLVCSWLRSAHTGERSSPMPPRLVVSSWVGVRHIRAKLASSVSPASSDFSGKNCVPKTGSWQIRAVKSIPWLQTP